VGVHPANIDGVLILSLDIISNIKGEKTTNTSTRTHMHSLLQTLNTPTHLHNSKSFKGILLPFLQLMKCRGTRAHTFTVFCHSLTCGIRSSFHVLRIQFTPTVPHCKYVLCVLLIVTWCASSLTTTIGLCLREKLRQNLPDFSQWKVSSQLSLLLNNVLTTCRLTSQ
jgi:glutaredoxin-related protein